MSAGPLLDLSLQSIYTIPGANVLVNGDFEGAAGPPPAGWTQLNTLMTRVAGQRTGGVGSFVGQIGYDGSHATGQGLETACIVGATYVYDGWVQGDGAAIPQYNEGGAIIATGLASATWQHIVVSRTNTGSYFCLQCSNLSAGHFIQADDMQAIPQLNVTRNQGLLQGYVQAGDGLTPATIPAMIGGGRRGIKLVTANTQRLAWLNPIASSTYSVSMTIYVQNAAANAGYLFDCRDSGGTGYALLNAGGVYSHSSGTAYLNNQLLVSSLSVVPYGTLGVLVVSGITLQVVTKMMIGCRNDASIGWNGSIFDFKMFAGTLTPTEVRSVTERSMSMLSYY